MPRFDRRSRTMRIISRCFLLASLFAIGGRALLGQHSLPSGAKFEVVSVRILSSKEAADRSPDFIGPDVAVRMRLSCSGAGFYFYTWRDDITPHGYSVQLTGNGMVWRNKMPGQTEQGSSPGIEKLDAFVPGVWRLMSGHTRPAVEWEELDSTSFSGEKHAFTTFIKVDEKSKPVEIVSDSYAVPAGPASAK
jgi:hypothetical protein